MTCSFSVTVRFEHPVSHKGSPEDDAASVASLRDGNYSGTGFIKRREEFSDSSWKRESVNMFDPISFWPLGLLYLFDPISFWHLGLLWTGCEVLFSLETASDYLKDEKASFFGFKCTVIGYEWNSKAEDVRTMFYDLLQCDVQAMLQSFRKRDGVV